MSCPRPNTPRSDPKDVGELAEPLRSRISTAIHDAPAAGLVLVSGYRDPGRQWDLRHERCRGRECDSGCKGYPVTAVPARLVDGEWVGGSKHQHRKAADMGGRDLDWLIRNRFAYGLVLTVKSENWHFEAEGIDARTGRRAGPPTVRIIPYGGGQPPSPTQESFMPALNDAEQRELLAIARRLDQTTERRPVPVRDDRTGQVWVVDLGAGTKWWCKTMHLLNLGVFFGQIAGFGTDGPVLASALPGFRLDLLTEVEAPEGVGALA